MPNMDGTGPEGKGCPKKVEVRRLGRGYRGGRGCGHREECCGRRCEVRHMRNMRRNGIFNPRRIEARPVRPE